MSKSTYKDGIKRIETDFGSISIPQTKWEHRWDVLGTWVSRIVVAILWIVVIVLIVGYFGYCAPHWFDTVLNAPLICLPHR